MLVVCQYSKKPSPSPPPIKKVGGSRRGREGIWLHRVIFESGACRH